MSSCGWKDQRTQPYQRMTRLIWSTNQFSVQVVRCSNSTRFRLPSPLNHRPTNRPRHALALIIGSKMGQSSPTPAPESKEHTCSAPLAIATVLRFRQRSPTDEHSSHKNFQSRVKHVAHDPTSSHDPNLAHKPAVLCFFSTNNTMDEPSCSHQRFVLHRIADHDHIAYLGSFPPQRVTSARVLRVTNQSSPTGQHDASHPRWNLLQATQKRLSPAPPMPWDRAIPRSTVHVPFLACVGTPFLTPWTRGLRRVVLTGKTLRWATELAGIWKGSNEGGRHVHLTFGRLATNLHTGVCSTLHRDEDPQGSEK